LGESLPAKRVDQRPPGRTRKTKGIRKRNLRRFWLSGRKKEKKPKSRAGPNLKRRDTEAEKNDARPPGYEERGCGGGGGGVKWGGPRRVDKEYKERG